MPSVSVVKRLSQPKSRPIPQRQPEEGFDLKPFFGRASAGMLDIQDVNQRAALAVRSGAKPSLVNKVALDTRLDYNGVERLLSKVGLYPEMAWAGGIPAPKPKPKQGLDWSISEILALPTWGQTKRALVSATRDYLRWAGKEMLEDPEGGILKGVSAIPGTVGVMGQVGEVGSQIMRGWDAFTSRVSAAAYLGMADPGVAKGGPRLPSKGLPFAIKDGWAASAEKPSLGAAMGLPEGSLQRWAADVGGSLAVDPSMYLGPIGLARGARFIAEAAKLAKPHAVQGVLAAKSRAEVDDLFESFTSTGWSKHAREMIAADTPEKAKVALESALRGGAVPQPKMTLYKGLYHLPRQGQLWQLASDDAPEEAFKLARNVYRFPEERAQQFSNEIAAASPKERSRLYTDLEQEWADKVGIPKRDGKTDWAYVTGGRKYVLEAEGQNLYGLLEGEAIPKAVVKAQQAEVYHRFHIDPGSARAFNSRLRRQISEHPTAELREPLTGLNLNVAAAVNLPIMMAAKALNTGMRINKIVWLGVPGIPFVVAAQLKTPFMVWADEKLRTFFIEGIRGHLRTLGAGTRKEPLELAQDVAEEISQGQGKVFSSRYARLEPTPQAKRLGRVFPDRHARSLAQEINRQFATDPAFKALVRGDEYGAISVLSAEYKGNETAVREALALRKSQLERLTSINGQVIPEMRDILRRAADGEVISARELARLAVKPEARGKARISARDVELSDLEQIVYAPYAWISGRRRSQVFQSTARAEEARRTALAAEQGLYLSKQRLGEIAEQMNRGEDIAEVIQAYGPSKAIAALPGKTRYQPDIELARLLKKGDVEGWMRATYDLWRRDPDGAIAEVVAASRKQADLIQRIDQFAITAEPKAKAFWKMAAGRAEFVPRHPGRVPQQYQPLKGELAKAAKGAVRVEKTGAIRPVTSVRAVTEDEAAGLMEQLGFVTDRKIAKASARAGKEAANRITFSFAGRGPGSQIASNVVPFFNAIKDMHIYHLETTLRGNPKSAAIYAHAWAGASGDVNLGKDSESGRDLVIKGERWVFFPVQGNTWPELVGPHPLLGILLALAKHRFPEQKEIIEALYPYAGGPLWPRFYQQYGVDPIDFVPGSDSEGERTYPLRDDNKLRQFRRRIRLGGSEVRAGRFLSEKQLRALDRKLQSPWAPWGLLQQVGRGLKIEYNGDLEDSIALGIQSAQQIIMWGQRNKGKPPPPSEVEKWLRRYHPEWLPAGLGDGKTVSFFDLTEGGRREEFLAWAVKSGKGHLIWKTIPKWFNTEGAKDVEWDEWNDPTSGAFARAVNEGKRLPRPWSGILDSYAKRRAYFDLKAKDPNARDDDWRIPFDAQKYLPKESADSAKARKKNPLALSAPELAAGWRVSETGAKAMYSIAGKRDEIMNELREQGIKPDSKEAYSRWDDFAEMVIRTADKNPEILRPLKAGLERNYRRFSSLAKKSDDWRTFLDDLRWLDEGGGNWMVNDDGSIRAKPEPDGKVDKFIKNAIAERWSNLEWRKQYIAITGDATGKQSAWWLSYSLPGYMREAFGGS